MIKSRFTKMSATVQMIVNQFCIGIIYYRYVHFPCSKAHVLVFNV